ncbi:MAG: helix-turn-helix domain-containing protein [Phycisphaerales bacterium]|nr:helix-turn-helix domain-containing protein [Phycisphaerales bacterium]
MASVDRLMSPGEAATYLGVALSTLNNWRVLRTGPSYTKAGRLVRYRESSLAAYLTSRSVSTSDQNAGKAGAA